MRLYLISLLLTCTLAGPANAQSAPDVGSKPTIVLVHGAFAGSSSWNGVIGELARDGYPVTAAAVPLRSLKGDAQYVSSLVTSIAGPVVLVGHSYGGEVISVAAADLSNVKALVFVSGFAPDIGESASSLSARFPTGTLGSTLAPPVKLADGSADLYILQSHYRKQFAADVRKADAVQMASGEDEPFRPGGPPGPRTRLPPGGLPGPRGGLGAVRWAVTPTVAAVERKDVNSAERAPVRRDGGMAALRTSMFGARLWRA